MHPDQPQNRVLIKSCETMLYDPASGFHEGSSTLNIDPRTLFQAA